MDDYDDADFFEGPVRFGDRVDLVRRGRREVTVGFEHPGTAFTGAEWHELTEKVADALDGLDDATVTVSGSTADVGDYGYGGEIVSCYELDDVAVTVTGTRPLTVAERSAVASAAAEARRARDRERDLRSRPRPSSGRLGRIPTI